MVKRRDHFIEFFFYNVQLIKDNILPFLGLIISIIGTKNDFTPYIKLGFYLFIVFVIVFSFLKWYNKLFEFDESMIRISEGVFKKRKNDIPYNRVKSINTSDSMIKRFFGLANFSVELIGGNKVFFVMKNEQINEIKSQVFNTKEVTTEKPGPVRLKSSQYFLLALTSSSVFWTSFTFTVTTYSFLLTHFAEKLGLEGVKEEEENGVIGTWGQTDYLGLDFMMSIGSLCLIFVIPTCLISFICIKLTYGKFSIISDEKNIQVQYGIINKKNYHIPKKQIRSLRIAEPFLFRIFGYAQIKVDNIGLNENSSSVLIHPIVKKNEIHSIIDQHINFIKVQKITHQSQKKFLPHFLIRPVSKLVGITLLLSYLLRPTLLVLLFLLPFAILFGHTKWKYSGLSYDDEYMTIRFSKGLNIVTLTTLKMYTESTGTVQSIFMEKANIYHYQFAVYSEKGNEVYESMYLDSPNEVEFQNYLLNH